MHLFFSYFLFLFFSTVHGQSMCTSVYQPDTSANAIVFDLVVGSSNAVQLNGFNISVYNVYGDPTYFNVYYLAGGSTGYEICSGCWNVHYTSPYTTWSSGYQVITFPNLVLNPGTWGIYAFFSSGNVFMRVNYGTTTLSDAYGNSITNQGFAAPAWADPTVGYLIGCVKYGRASPTPTPSRTPSRSVSPSPTKTPSITPTRTPSPVSPSPTRTPSLTPTPSRTPSVSPSPSRTPSVSPSKTPSISTSPSRTPSPSASPVSPSSSPSQAASPSPTSSPTPSASESPTASPSSSASVTPSGSISPSAFLSLAPSASPSTEVDSGTSKLSWGFSAFLASTWLLLCFV